jgi:hypothetical protein
MLLEAASVPASNLALMLHPPQRNLPPPASAAALMSCKPDSCQKS